MRETEYNPVTLSIDLKKYRIRVHKSTLHLLGDPRYIQLLINPSDQIVAIRSVERWSTLKRIISAGFPLRA